MSICPVCVYMNVDIDEEYPHSSVNAHEPADSAAASLIPCRRTVDPTPTRSPAAATSGSRTGGAPASAKAEYVWYLVTVHHVVQDTQDTQDNDVDARFERMR